MKKILCAGTMLILFGCKRYTCECSSVNQQNRSSDAYQITAHDKPEALSKCTDKHNKNSIGTQKTYCEIK